MPAARAASDSIPPISRNLQYPARVATRLYSADPPIILVELAGRVSVRDLEGASNFDSVLSSLQGRPFRVLGDFSQLVTLSEEICTRFIRAQEQAVQRGMERDALVSESSMVRLQFSRIARESGRRSSLGPVRFFDTLPEALEYLTR